MAAPRLLIVFALATLGVVLIVVALAAERWWVLPIALAAHAGGFVLAVGATRAAAEQQTKPDPVTAARLEEEGSDGGDGDDDPDAPKMAI